MVVTRKKTKQSTLADLVNALEQFAYHLDGQKEDDASADIRIAKRTLQEHPLGSTESKAALRLIEESFGDLHELDAYTHHKPKPGSWSAAEELYLWSTTTLNLMRRIDSERS
ncbi:MAG: hypothetical protein AB8C84_04035 [Oligoflexales bacterium]